MSARTRASALGPAVAVARLADAVGVEILRNVALGDTVRAVARVRALGAVTGTLCDRKNNKPTD